MSDRYKVMVRNNWSYVVPIGTNPQAEHSGPWRYQWEAQEYADELNERAALQSTPDSEGKA